MIAIMRKIIHSNVYKIFLWAFLFMMAFGSGIAIFNFGESKDWVVKVYAQSISQQKFQEMLKLAKQQQEMYRQKSFAFPHKNIQKETVQVAVSSLLAQHAMDKIGMQVDPSYVDQQLQQQLQQLPSHFFKADGSLDQEAFQKAIAPHSMQDFIQEMELEAKNKLLFGLVDATVYVPEFEMILQYNAELANKKYSYFALPYQKYLAEVKADTPSDEILNKFYKKPSIADQFRTIQRRAGTMWKFIPSQFIAPISDNEAKAFYDKNKMHRYVLEPAQIQIRRLVIDPKTSTDMDARIKIEEISQTAQKDTSKFEDLVKEFSQDLKSATRGGLSNFFTKDDKNIDPTIIEMAFDNLATDGQVSIPLKTARGYELIQRVAKHPTKYKDFKSVEAEIKKDLTVEKFKKRFMQDASRIVSGAKYNPESLQKFIERYKGVKVEIPLEAQKSSIEGIHLFRIEEGRYTSFLDKDFGAILLCSQVEKSRLPALSEVKTKVLSLYFEEKANAKLKDELAAAFKDANHMKLSELATKYGATIAQASFENKDGKIEQSPILKENEVAQALKGMQHEGSMASVKTKTDGILIKLDSISKVNPELFKEQKEHLGRVMFYMKLYQIKEGFIASLYRTATLNNKIEIKNELLQFTKEV
ncbi:SurA N-terminal domain-containing protein [Candidatus Babeliales bacterium]|nr:SurA N-terminal domain-containing protein [Candidatus Babeliales bacterium]